ncbi:hypothetical protein D1818_13030 [Aquimarina sp. BL5]|uniref:hypothetical protein n=1 Tax=Aquimarina sp. BL5 TaxID=1714860 RepID=UPI000E47A465|nr:hypothetical protein [Aquimarina sp. BL5]AXT51719.1 hypothetical protein D1818_13030 [Aquimarina sp. BL5]RKN08811.1 hypothetical protein D7036_05315 [Aquimarina sp. BL5]
MNDKIFKISILLLTLIICNSCSQTPKENYEKLKAIKIQGLIIATKTGKGGYSLLVTERKDTFQIWNTFVQNAHISFFVGDSIFKHKGEMIYKVKRNDSSHTFDASGAIFNY